MHLQALLLAGLALATGTAADRIMTTRACNWLGSCSATGEWQYDNGEKDWFNANKGCRNAGIAHVGKGCMDWGDGRAHFMFDGTKMCFQKTGKDFDVGPCADSSLKCSRQWWEVVDCSW